MLLDTIKKYQAVHTWVGIIAGLALYICFVGGALTMFKAPLNQWALHHETTLPNIEVENYDELIKKVLAAYPESAGNLSVYLPGSGPQSAPVSWLVENPKTHEVSRWHATLTNNGELLAEQSSVSAIGDFFDWLHRTAGIPGGESHGAIGTYVMGVVAALYFVAMVSGIIIFLPSWLKDLFVLRRGKNRKRYWLDFHNVLGISALPFHLIIAFTSFVFAYHDLIYDGLRKVVYEDKAMFPAMMAKAPQNHAQLQNISSLEQAVQTLSPEFKAVKLNFRRLNTPAAMVFVNGDYTGQLQRDAEFASAALNPYTAEPVFISMLPGQFNAYSQVVASFFALHLGNYGGYLVRWLYFLLAVSGALLFVTGNILWIESRRKKASSAHAPPPLSCRIMTKLTAGVCLGTLAGIALSLLAAKCLSQQTLDITFWQKTAYYCGFLSSLLWAFLRRPLQATRELLAFTAVLLLCLPVASFWTASHHSLGVSLTAFTAAILLTALSNRIRSRSYITTANSAWV